MSLVVPKVIGEQMMALAVATMMMSIEDGGIIWRIIITIPMNVIVVVILIIRTIRRDNDNNNNQWRDATAATMRKTIMMITRTRIDLLLGLLFKAESVGLNRMEHLWILVEDNED